MVHIVDIEMDILVDQLAIGLKSLAGVRANVPVRIEEDYLNMFPLKAMMFVLHMTKMLI
jgi:hypothetical protein